MESSYQITFHPLTGDIMWNINDIDLATTDAGHSFISNFIECYSYENYSLSIYNTVTETSIGIHCEITQIPDIVSYIYHLEHASITFIGINSLAESYVVGMELTKGRLSGEYYKCVDNRLLKNF